MAHDHSHHEHGHPVVLENINRAFIVGIVLNLLFVVIEAGVGIYIDSLSLLSDAGHNLADVGSLALSLLAFRLLKVKANEKYTYGYRKTSILAALFNAVILLVSIGAIIYEAIHRFFEPAVLPGKTIAIVAGIGIIINFCTAILFRGNKEKDMNVKSAYLHLMADALVSVAMVVGGIIILFTGWYWIDPLLGILVSVVILIGTWHLLKDSLRLSLDGVPKDIDMETVKKNTLRVKGIKAVHHVHVWAMSTTENAMTGHFILEDGTSLEEEAKIKQELRHEMQHLQINHLTIETERDDLDCEEKDCK
ncbi:MAG: cation transporter [Bacteroidetes bacterium]|nr:cation transporter [Bacteroidota bacterium]